MLERRFDANTPETPTPRSAEAPNVFEAPRVFEAPKRHASPDTEPAPLETVSYAKRFLARGIDWFLLPVTSGVLVGVAALSKGLPAEGAGSTPFFHAILIVVTVLLETLGAGTPGKLVLGLRVLHEDGRPCSLKGSIARTLAVYVDGLFIGLIGYFAVKDSPLHQRHGDRWAKTIVVRASSVPQASQRGVPNTIMAYGASLLVMVTLAFVFA